MKRKSNKNIDQIFYDVVADEVDLHTHDRELEDEVQVEEPEAVSTLQLEE